MAKSKVTSLRATGQVLPATCFLPDAAREKLGTLVTQYPAAPAPEAT